MCNIDEGKDSGEKMKNLLVDVRMNKILSIIVCKTQLNNIQCRTRENEARRKIVWNVLFLRVKFLPYRYQQKLQ